MHPKNKCKQDCDVVYNILTHFSPSKPVLPINHMQKSVECLLLKPNC